MTGFMSKVVGADAIYEGGIKAHTDLENGMFVVVDYANGVTAFIPSEMTAPTIMMTVVEKFKMWGMDALRLSVNANVSGGNYFVEKVNPGTAPEYDDTDIITKAGEFARLHAPLIGEEMIITLDDGELYESLTVGTLVKPAPGENGTIQKVG